MPKVKAINNFHYQGLDVKQDQVLSVSKEDADFLTGEGVSAVVVIEEDAPAADETTTAPTDEQIQAEIEQSGEASAPSTQQPAAPAQGVASNE